MAVELFQACDSTRSGKITASDFPSFYDRLIAARYTSKSLQDCLSELDINSDNIIQFNEVSAHDIFQGP